MACDSCGDYTRGRRHGEVYRGLDDIMRDVYMPKFSSGYLSSDHRNRD